VKDNQGGPGVDQMTIEQFEQNLTDLQSELERGDYRPLPVLRVYIDKYILRK
jgi:retron-type reverse transcriptase